MTTRYFVHKRVKGRGSVMSFLSCNHETELINKPARFPPQGRFGVRDSDRLDHLSIQGTELPGASRDSPPLVLSDLLLLGAGRSHCVPAQLAEHLRAVRQGQKSTITAKKKKTPMGRCCEATVTNSCCEAESAPEQGGCPKSGGLCVVWRNSE